VPEGLKPLKIFVFPTRLLAAFFADLDVGGGVLSIFHNPSSSKPIIKPERFESKHCASSAIIDDATLSGMFSTCDSPFGAAPKAFGATPG
jgi:hypothetical protein